MRQEPISHRLYHENYYSGPQVRVYINGIWVDDIIRLEWTPVQNKRPIWGYSSTYFDAIAAGTVLISGSFSMNFRYDGYLATILGYIDNITAEQPPNRFGSLIDPESLNPSVANRADISTILFQGDPGLNANKGDFIDSSKLSSIKPNRPASLQQQSVYSSNEAISNEYIRRLEDEFWNNVKYEANTINEGRKLRPDNLPLFDIIVSFGDFNLDELANPDTLASSEQIRNCSIINYSKGLDADGNPVIETYSFIAQEVI